MSTLCSSITDGEHNTVVDTPGGGYYLLSCKNLKDGKVTITIEREISLKTYERIHKRTKLEKGDILLSSVGTIGECVYLSENPTNYEFQRSVAIIKPKDKESGLTIYMALKRQKRELEILSHGAVQRCLFISDLSNFEVEIPNPCEKTRTFINHSEKHLIAVSRNNKQMEKLSLLRDSLLPLLMNGQVSVKPLNNHLSEWGALVFRNVVGFATQGIFQNCLHKVICRKVQGCFLDLASAFGSVVCCFG